jgi:hypothetical protein
MSFPELLTSAQRGQGFAAELILKQYRPLLVKESILGGTFDDDLYQELCLTLMNCIRMFKT